MPREKPFLEGRKYPWGEKDVKGLATGGVKLKKHD